MRKSSPSIWHYAVSVKLTVKISSIFVAFLENTNFNTVRFDTNFSHFSNTILKIKNEFVFGWRPTRKHYVFWHLKSVNLQYNTLVRLDDGTNKSSTKRLMFQVLFFFMISRKILYKNPFNLFSYFSIKLKK